MRIHDKLEKLASDTSLCGSEPEEPGQFVTSSDKHFREANFVTKSLEWSWGPVIRKSLPGPKI